VDQDEHEEARAITRQREIECQREKELAGKEFVLVQRELKLLYISRRDEMMHTLNSNIDGNDDKVTNTMDVSAFVL